ncbi:helix-turn-helix domain-containing protein [Desulfobacula phenolica]|uniref:Helix-turn-helix domain-containing protein n=1 Tax=Desulfobacula phenolica TaxID=90732 RepID=A0A1H2FJZ0_9BACT|nr:AraC family transcriptional regulator [Desulfobacula phenolica]SDU07268.1 Helix-turn-helix domain-containing protein [Desulfobacula phenolica]
MEKKLKRHTLDSFPVKKGNFETCWKLPHKIGKGTIKEFRLKSGIQVYICNYNKSNRLKAKHYGETPKFGFRFCLSGTTKLTLHCLKQSLTITHGESGFFYFPNRDGFYEDIPGTPIYMVVILISPSYWDILMEDELHDIPIKFKAPLTDNKNSSDPFNCTEIITPSMHMILQQIIHCPYEGASHRFFIEAKAMELIACKLNQIKPASHKQKPTPRLKANDIDKIHYAGQLLSNNLQTPPNIIELAKTVGVSRTKFYNDFNQFYGTSPIEYLRFKRAEKARTLVKDESLSMTQIAYSLGYSSSSHFAKAFRDYFGIPPSRYRQNERW